MTLAEAIAKIPVGFYLSCAVEQAEDDDELFMSATIMQEPPPEGWPSLAAYFGTPGYPEDGRLKLYRSDDVARVGVSAALDDPHTLERLAVDMIIEFSAKFTKEKQ